MRTALATVLAVAIILLLWTYLGSSTLPQISAPVPPPDPSSLTLAPIASADPPLAAALVAPPPAPIQTAALPVDMSLTESEKAIKAKLEKQVAAATPTHTITFDKFRTLTGWIIKETTGTVTFSESYGDTGSMTVNIARPRIVSLVALTNAPPVITDRDVRFQLEFPKFNLFKRYPYTIVTDESFFQVERIVRELQNTYGQFTSRFAPLIHHDRANVSDIQVLVFTSQGAFRDYAKGHFNGTNDIAGFYMVNKDRLIVFNQTTAQWIDDVINKEEADALRRYGNTPQVRAELTKRRGGREDDLKQFARRFTLETVRHEGTHQMCYTLGVLGTYPHDLMWLTEGLAMCSETDHLNDVNPWRVSELKHLFPNDAYPSISNVILASTKPDYMDSYSSYWALCRFLMDSSHRNAFLQFIRSLNDPVTWQTTPPPTDLDLLCHFLAIDPPALEKEWQTFLRHQ